MAQKANRIQIASNRFFDSHLAGQRNGLETGKLDRSSNSGSWIIGRVHTMSDVGDLEYSAGLIAAKAIRLFGLTRWLLEDEITDVMCMGSALINPAYMSVCQIFKVNTSLRGPCGPHVIFRTAGAQATAITSE